ncbi:hypothetical protein ABT187_43290 [Streptomyces sp. NPDC001817]|uniref:hypothetical protein n=1 Tax=Streptomyces sp. NPDC001817 TaxID=3154398 RepID=UPI003330A7CE
MTIRNAAGLTAALIMAAAAMAITPTAQAAAPTAGTHTSAMRPATQGAEADQTYNVTLIPGIYSVTVRATSPVPSEGVAVEATYKVSGIREQPYSFRLTRSDSLKAIHHSVLVAKSDLTYKLNSDFSAISVQGPACFWQMIRWKCIDVSASLPL